MMSWILRTHSEGLYQERTEPTVLPILTRFFGPLLLATHVVNINCRCIRVQEDTCYSLNIELYHSCCKGFGGATEYLTWESYVK